LSAEIDIAKPATDPRVEGAKAKQPPVGARSVQTILERSFFAPGSDDVAVDEPPSATKRFINAVIARRFLKIALGIGLVVAFGWAPLRAMLATTSVEAIVNARIETIRAPIEGIVHPFHASLYDLATRFLPYFLWSGLVMSWLSGGKVMPILFDVSQIIVMPQILKAALFGLTRPQGQKFQVTAKGGDRNQGFVEWTVMRPFVGLLVLSLAAVLWAFYVNGGSNEIHYSSPALTWTWYNLIVLVVLCFVCIERPRHRAAERFASRELVSVKTAERTQLMQLDDVSITGARIFGVPLGAPGESVQLELPNFRISATIVRREGNTFAVAFNHSLKSRVAAIQHFYSGGYLRPLGSIRVLRVAESVLRRVFD
jgi:hypothetical protein